MNIIFRTITLFLALSSIAAAQVGSPYKVNFKYKAYWLGFVVAEIESQTILDATNYEISAEYRAKGIATIMGKMNNTTMSRGILHTNGKFRPEFYESMGNFGKLKYNNQVSFDPETLKVTNLVQDIELRENTEYIPVAEAEKYGIDPMTMYLNMIMTPNFAETYREEYKERQFGGMFVSEQSFTCDDSEVIKKERRSVFAGETIICKVEGKAIAGDIKRTKPRKKRKKGREDDDQDSRLWFGKMDGFDGTIPVYTELPLGWSKVRIYLSEFSVEAMDRPLVNAEMAK